VIFIVFYQKVLDMALFAVVRSSLPLTSAKALNLNRVDTAVSFICSNENLYLVSVVLVKSSKFETFIIGYAGFSLAFVARSFVF
jgi:hypothetical protein